MPRYKIKLNNERRSHLENIIIGVQSDTYNHRYESHRQSGAINFKNAESKARYGEIYNKPKKSINIYEYIDKHTNRQIKNKISDKEKDKAIVIFLRALGTDIATITHKTKLSKRTIINYIVGYSNTNDTNWKSFFHNRNYAKSDLSKYRGPILTEFKKKPPITYKEATLRIEKLFGIKRSEIQITKFLNSMKIYTLRSKKIGYIGRKKLGKQFREAYKTN